MATKGTPRGVIPQVQGAQRRAQLVAFLTAQETPQTLKQIADALGWAESGTAYTARVATQSGLIRSRKEPFKNQLLYFMGNGEEPEPYPMPEGNSGNGGNGEVVGPVIGRPKGSKTRIVAAREVELVVAGVLVILGRNPASGRLRIVLEEM